VHPNEQPAEGPCRCSDDRSYTPHVSEPAGSVAVLVPVKAFRDAKARLSDVLSPAERAALARSMAASVVAAAAPLPVWIVCDDDEVVAWADSVGASVLWKPGRGLNGAVEEGVADLARRGIDTVIVAHADLPHAVELSHLATGEGVTLVPDRHDDGTNVVVVPARCGFVFAYGPGSFHRHREEAARLGLPLRVVNEARLAWDVDLPDDLLAPDWDACPS
jgi:2-phospho-L-lactate/phosphoenolpyruvate guanylyltransferase